MASIVKRRPLPALIALLALLLLTALVWWRVLNRSDGSTHHTATKPCPTATVAVRLPAPSAVTVHVLNATTRNGIGGKARSALVDDGFKIPSVATNDLKKHINKIKTTAQIRYGTTTRPAAELLRYYLPGASLVPLKTPSKLLVVALGTKYRAVASPAAVRAALKRDHAVAGTPTTSASCTPSPSGSSSSSSQPSSSSPAPSGTAS